MNRQAEVLRAAAYVEKKNKEKTENSNRNHFIALIAIVAVGCLAIGLVL